ncbi:hypothetical protein Gogos_010030 [Gossypium gossypioides]|uniref:Uncharacterized protein n=1 Tax=Gossypium gossypioides TaxID=34282 RepID=A0A7J9BK21_GOSGO|nr:hypothetical protein [Gossypium gossypioides]
MTTLCKRARVPMSPTRQFVMPTKSVLENNTYGKFVDLQQKHLTDLTNMSDMEWAIRWMQEMSPMGIDYSQRHDICVPNPSSSKYAPVQYSNDTEGRNEDDDDNEEDNDKRDDDDKFIFYTL